MAPKKKSGGVTSTIAGARGSTAGDVYHELWALRAALGLLTPKASLQAVTVEGIAAPVGSVDRYAAVDCGLFYGGRSISSATAIDLVQLKYSTSNPTSNWTVSRLTASDATSKDNSVVRGLADSFVNATKDKSPSAALRIKLVSNQPIAAGVLKAAGKIIAGDRTDEDCKKLVKASGLKRAVIAEFFSALSFSDMGGASHEGLQSAIAETVSQMAEEDIDERIGAQRTKIRDLMLPGREREFITAATVRLWFNVSSEAGLFPASTDLQPLGAIIQRAPTDELLAALNRGERLICLDGAGGCGKTTTMRQLGSRMPTGSLSVLYDCYGAGRYMHSDQKRHLPEIAFLQIVNELAFEQGLPLLMPNSSSKKADIRTFMERVSRSAELLKKASPSGLLAVLIDAADNSVNAAEHWHEPCFAREIATADLASLPSNVVIIFSTRTARKTKLHLPAAVTSVPCPAFTRPETRAFADLLIKPPATEAWIDQFYHFSRAIPRVQSVAMKAGGQDPSKVLQFLMPDGKGLADVLEAQLKEAALKVGDSTFYQNVIAALSALPPPIPVNHLAAICGVSESIVTDFISDVSPSLRLEPSGVTIADEDTEDFLEVAGKPSRQAIISRSCSVLAPIMETDTYTATHYCDLLVEDGRAGEVLSIVEKNLEPKGISDPVVKREVQLRRLRLAMNACAHKSTPTEMIKVALLGAEATKDEAALRELLERKPELSVRFAEASLQRLILSNRDRFARQGAALAHLAASAALGGDLVTAREKSYLFEKWREAVKDLPEHEKVGIELTLDDWAALAEARVLISGLGRYAKYLISYWQTPYQVEIASKLVPQLIAHGNAKAILSLYKGWPVSAVRKLFMAVPLALAGETVAVDGFTKALKTLRGKAVPDLRQAREDWERTYLELIISACEIAFSRKAPKAAIKRSLDCILDHRKASAPEIRRLDAWRIDVAIRAWLLREQLVGRVPTEEKFLKFCADTNEPRPPPPEPEKNKRREPEEYRQTDRHVAEERELFKRTVGAIFALYRTRVEILAECAQGTLAAEFEKRLPTLGDDYSFNREYHANAYRAVAGRSVARLLHLKAVDVPALMTRAIEVAKADNDGITAFRAKPIWHEFLIRQVTHADILTGVTKRAAEMANLRVGATEKADALLDFSHLVLNFSVQDAQALFNQAVEIAKEIDRDAMVQIEFIARLAKESAAFDTATRKQLAIDMASFVTDVGIRLDGYDHFPWYSGVQGIYDFMPEVALAAISQWHDEGIARLSGTLPALVLQMAKDPARLPSACALTFLLRVFPDRTFAKLAAAANALPQAAARGLLEVLSRKAALDTAEDRRDPLEDALVGQPQLAKSNLRLSSYVEASKLARPATKPSKPKKSDAKAIVIPPGSKFGTEAEIKQSMKQLRYSLKGVHIPLSEVLNKIRTKITSPGQRVPYLNAVGKLENDYDADGQAVAILDALKAWDGQPAVDAWRRDVLPKVIATHFVGFARWIYEGQSKLPALVEATRLDAKAALALLGIALQQSAEHLSSGSLYAVCAMLASHLSGGDAKELTQWYVARISKYLLPDIKVPFEACHIPNVWDEALGRFMFAMLSDFDQRVRWRAAHCLRQLTSLDRGAALSSTLSQYDRVAEPAFRLHTAPFYWMAARLWTVMLLSRVALENPQEVAPHTAKLLAIASDDVFPHYLIRYYAKRAIEHLASAKAVTLSPKQAKAFATVNKPRLASVTAKRGLSRDLERSDGSGRRFHFDGLDTIPYWYSPLYVNFANLTPDGFFKVMERWIVDEWGANETVNHWDKEPRKGRLSESESMKTYRGHGGYPTIERYGSYLEWHAMFCGLGELIKKYALRKSDDHGDSIDDWMRRWLPTEIDTWLSDRRSPRPLGAEFSIAQTGADSSWLKQATDEQFIAYFMGQAPNAAAPITVYSEWTVTAETRELRVEVTTALVLPNAANALLRALTDAEESYWLPTETDRDDTEGEFEKAPFKLQPVVRRVGRDTNIDEDDPLRKEVSGLRVQPADTLQKKYKWRPAGSPISAWQSKSVTVAQYEAWSESEERENSHRSRRESGVEGYRLTLDKAALSAMLLAEGMDLVVEVAVERRLEDKYGERSSWNDKANRKKVRKAYLLRQSGEVEGVAGRIGAWR